MRRLARWCTGAPIPADPLDETRVLVFTVGTLATLMVLVFYAVFFWCYGRPFDAGVMFVLVPTTVLNAARCYRGHSVVSALHALGGGMLFLICYLVVREGGIGPTVWWLTIPAYTFVNATLYRAGGIALAVAIAFQVALEALRRAGVVLPSDLGSDPELLALTSRIGLFIAILLSLFVLDRLRVKTLDALTATNSALQRANNRVHAAAQAKSRFLATMSHEIRTPLNGMLGAGELLRRTPLDLAQQRYVDIVGRSGQHLMVLVNDILDFSKLEAGKLELEQTSFRLRDALEDLAESCAPLAHRKGLILTARLDPDVPPGMVGDVMRLRQVLANLLGNAIKFTAAGTVSLEVVLAAPLAEGRAQVEFRVRDTGIGIDTAEVPHLFEAFRQADESTTRLYGGTGLGLAICAELVRLMGGRIDVDSRLGAGACFAFQITFAVDAAVRETGYIEPPLGVAVLEPHAEAAAALCATLSSLGVRARDAMTQPHAQPPPDLLLVSARAHCDPGASLLLATWPASVPRVTLVPFGQDPASAGLDAGARVLCEPVRRTGLRAMLLEMTGRACDAPAAAPRAIGQHALNVLLVEDNDVNRLIATTMLEQAGCRVDAAPDGAEGVGAWTRTPYDVVLMDCQMPVLDGLAATTRIRALEAATGRPRTRIVALTANAFREDRERCLAAGMDDFLAKPFRLEQLLSVLSPTADAVQACDVT